MTQDQWFLVGVVALWGLFSWVSGCWGGWAKGYDRGHRDGYRAGVRAALFDGERDGAEQ